MMKLYSFHSSSASYRARIGLNLKNAPYEIVPVAFHRDGTGEHMGEAYTQLNPQQLVPALETEQGMIPQSLAILGYLDGKFPDPPFMPKEPWGRAMIMSIACNICCDIHPVNNLRIRQYLKNPLHHSDAEVEEWQRHWIDVSFTGLEEWVKRQRGKYCYGDEPTVADICLVPQVTNARRVRMDMAKFPNLNEIDALCREHPAFVKAAPDQQPDWPAR
jgi:maleylacetoacetate isomerase